MHHPLEMVIKQNNYDKNKVDELCTRTINEINVSIGVY